MMRRALRRWRLLRLAEWFIAAGEDDLALSTLRLIGAC